MTVRRLLAVLTATIALACSAIPVPHRAPYHASDADLTITRLVHSSVIVDLAGTRLLIDPWFHSGLLVRQAEPLGLTPDGLPPLHAILLTHDHRDHLDEHALRALAATVPEVIARPELHRQLASFGFHRVTDLVWWESAQVGPVTVTAVPASRSRAENGYVIESANASAYAAGDTRAFPALADIAARFPHLDAALLPIGGERLLGVLRQMGPTEAAEAAVLLGARRVIPIGYGERSAPPLWWYAWRPMARFREACARQGLERSRIVVLETGESWHYYR